MRFALALLLLTACAQEPQFQVRDLKSDGSEYQMIAGTLIQTKGSTDADYLVFLRVQRLSGGDPAHWPSDTTHDYVWVSSGFGRVAHYAGNQRDLRIAITPVGYVRFKPLPGK